MNNRKPQPSDGPDFFAEQPLMSPYEKPAESEFPPGSLFHPDSFGPVTIITMQRLYDVGMALLSVIDEGRAVGLADLHAQGKTATPPPAFTEDDE